MPVVHPEVETVWHLFVIKVQDRDRLQAWSDELIKGADGKVTDEIVAQFADFCSYITEVIDDRRANLRDDLTSILTLYPGDVISSGTPDGVGAGRKPPEFLKPGVPLELNVEQRRGRPYQRPDEAGHEALAEQERPARDAQVSPCPLPSSDLSCPRDRACLTLTSLPRRPCLWRPSPESRRMIGVECGRDGRVYVLS